VNDSLYAYIVIGKGLLGTAAARHLSATQQRVALIGPDEPADRARHQGVFGSHYDEGRITRALDPDRTWALLAQRSIARYRSIETASGVPFYDDTGHLMVGAPDRPDHFVSRVQQVAANLGIPYESYSGAALAERFSYLTFEPGSSGMYQPYGSGHISPRAQVRAQAYLAQQQGTTLVPEIVMALRQTPNYIELQTDEHHIYRAEHVLLATGGFSNASALLPRPLAITVYARTIVLMELDTPEVERLRYMPSIIYKPRDMANRCYILPPIQYPDGKYYVKIGGGHNDPVLPTLTDLQDWFRSSGSASAARHLTEILHTVIPDLRPVSVHSDTCVTTDTATGQVYAERLQGGRLGILVGGNGSAAKSADEIGRLGALMMQLPTWHYDLAADNFKAQFAD
jgi:sarcosine oxidase